MSEKATKSSSGWLRLKKCPVCGHDGFCTRTADGEVIKCMRVANDRPIKQRDGQVAYYYRADQLGGVLPKARPAPAPPRRSTAEWKNIIKNHQTAVSPERLAKLSRTLGVSVRALKLYGVGIDVGDGRGGCGTNWWSFPMYDGDRKPIGVRLRADDGSKRCVIGSQNGLFIPTNYDTTPIVDGVTDDDAPLLLLLPEGPTSAAAAADLGFRAIGRPNNRMGSAMIRRLLDQGAPQDVIILADHEPMKFVGIGVRVPTWPGWEGALHTAGELLGCPGIRRLRVVKVKDASGNRVKDLRVFIQSGGVANVVNHVIAAGEDVDAGWLRAKWAEVELWRGKLRRQQTQEVNQ